MMHTRATVGILLAVLLGSSLALGWTAYATPQNNVDQTKAEKFVEIARRAQERAEKFRDLAAEKDVNVTAANDLIDQGATLLREAQTALGAGDYQTVFQKAREAQSKFREAIITLGDEVGGEAEEEISDQLSTAIARTEDRIQRLKNLLSHITPTPENEAYINAVNGNLTEAEKNLKDATAALDEEPANVSAAASLLTEANENMHEAFKALKQIGDWNIGLRVKNFLKGLMERVNAVEDRLDRLEARGVDVSDLKAKLTEAKALIQSAVGKALGGDKRAAVDDIKEARDDLHEVMKGLAERSGDRGNHEHGPPA